MASVREAAGCIGLSGGISLVGDFFGYRDHDGHVHIPRRLSLLHQMRLLRGSFIDLNLIRVGVEAFGDPEEEEINRAVDLMRELYAAVDLGIGRVERWHIHQAEAHGLDHIHSKADAKELTDDFTIDNDSIDIYFVCFNDADFVGLSYPCATCIKDTVGIMTGCVVELVDDGYVSTGAYFSVTGLVLAHEVGHHLGLSTHRRGSDNLMHESAPNGGDLTAAQGGVMRRHCAVKVCHFKQDRFGNRVKDVHLNGYKGVETCRHE